MIFKTVIFARLGQEPFRPGKLPYNQMKPRRIHKERKRKLPDSELVRAGAKLLASYLIHERVVIDHEEAAAKAELYFRDPSFSTFVTEVDPIKTYRSVGSV